MAAGPDGRTTLEPLRPVGGRPVALVTGGAGGIGRAIAERLAGDGHLVAVNDIDDVAAKDVAAAVDGLAVPGDLGNAAEAARVVADTVMTLGGLQVLVNNAGIEGRRPLREHSVDLWRRVLDVNLTAAFLTSRAAVDMLAASGRGAIVNVASIAVTGSAGQAAYDASKGGLQTLTRSLALELGPEGIRVNAVCPGLVDTPMLQEDDLRRLATKVTTRLPIARLAKPNEVAAAVAFLASDDASYITGHSLYVDGGYARR